MSLTGRAAAVNARVERMLPDPRDFRSAAHSERVTARIGFWLGLAFVVCFVTGVISHLLQHPPDWFGWPSRPRRLYQLNQGIHVLAGIVALPLLVAKLWSVYPRLFAKPAVRSLPHLLERLSVLVLIGAAFFELFTGLFNAMQNYPWQGQFSFLATHYAVGWVAVGSVLLHVAVKLPVVRRALGAPPAEPTDEAGVLSRRGFMQSTWLAAGVAFVATAGAAVPAFRNLSVLSWRSDNGPQGVPINKTAEAAGVTEAARDAGYRLMVRGPDGAVEFSLAQLQALPQTTVELPIACVEGWSQSASWTGVRVRDLVHRVGPVRDVAVESLQRAGAYRRSLLPANHVGDPTTLLALRLNGEELDLDHGYPCRIIASNRPGVVQTKWVGSLEVR